MSTARQFVIMLLLLGAGGILSATGCGNHLDESMGAADYLVLFTTGTTFARVNEIVLQTGTTILRYPPPGFSLEYKIRVPFSLGYAEDSARFRRFPEVEVVTRSFVGQFH